MQTINKSEIMRSVAVSILLNGLVPYAVYNVLKLYMPSLEALLAAVIIPIIFNGYQLVKERKMDAFGMFTLFGFFMSIAVLFFGGDEHIILLRESLVTGLSGFVFIASLAYKRPLIYYFALKFTTADTEEDRRHFNENWKLPHFRKAMRTLTLGWGLLLVFEAATKCVLVYMLDVSTFLAISQFIFYGYMGISIYWNIWYVKSVKRKAAIIEN